jgi:hypothetical protein
MTVPNPDGLLAQYRLLGAVIDSDWATRLDHKVARHVIDRYYSKFGNSRASLRYLEKATGATRNSIITSTRRLTAKGVFPRARPGIGTRPTEFAINFDFGKPLSGAADSAATSGPPDNTACGAPDSTASASSGVPDYTESYLRDRLTSRSTESRNNGTPAVPPSGGLTPAPAGTAADPQKASKKASGPFDELWDAWGKKEKRADARNAYAKLAPDAELHATLVQTAAAWTASYTAIDRPKQYQKFLHNWINGECWLEDLPVPQENAKDAATARAKERGPRKSGATSPEPMGSAYGVSRGTPLGRHVVEIFGSKQETKTNGDIAHCFSHRIRGGAHDGKEFVHRYAFIDVKGMTDKGEAFFDGIRRSTGIRDVGPVSDFDGAVLCAVVSRGGRIEYEPTDQPAG